MRAPLLLFLAALGAGCATNADDASTTVLPRKDTGAAADGSGDSDPAKDTDAADETSLDTGSDADAADSAADDVAPLDGGVTELTFPATGDTKTIKKDPAIWNLGDAIEGTRKTKLAAATKLTGTWDFATNSLGTACGPLGLGNGRLAVDVTINGAPVGSLVVQKASGTSVPIAFTFAAVVGPIYTLRYQVTATVTSGCGAVESAWDVSKLSLE